MGRSWLLLSQTLCALVHSFDTSIYRYVIHLMHGWFVAEGCVEESYKVDNVFTEKIPLYLSMFSVLDEFNELEIILSATNVDASHPLACISQLKVTYVQLSHRYPFFN